MIPDMPENACVITGARPLNDWAIIPPNCPRKPITPDKALVMPGTALAIAVIPSVIGCLNLLTKSRPAVTKEACKLPNAPSKVSVEVAACLATSVIPSCIMALLNSSAVICPLAIASRKLPVKAPFFFMASCNFPEAPGIASANWFQFSVVNLPAPAVWVNTIATDLKVSALPPATALRFPDACTSCP